MFRSHALFAAVTAASASVPSHGDAEKFINSKAEVTRLRNGIRVITHSVGGPEVSIGAYALAGPVYDPRNCPGVGALMHGALTRSNQNASRYQLSRNLRRHNITQAAFERYKHYVGLRIDTRENQWRPRASTRGLRTSGAAAQHEASVAQDNILSAMVAPCFAESDVRDVASKACRQQQEMAQTSPAQYAIDRLETVAFYGAPLGNPRYVPEANAPNITGERLAEQHRRCITPTRVIIAAVNIDHDALVMEYENTAVDHSSFGASTEPTEAAAAPACAAREGKGPSADLYNERKQYVGGERQEYVALPSGGGGDAAAAAKVTCAVGWLAYGRSRMVLRQYGAALVMRQLMQMALSSPVAGQPHGGVHEFYRPYQTAGLIGLTISAVPEHAVKMLTDAVRAVREQRFEASELIDAAKQQALANFMREATRSVGCYCDFLGTSLDAQSDRTMPVTVADVAAAIQAVTLTDVRDVRSVMSSAPTSLFGFGEVLAFPSLRQLGVGL